MGGTKQIIKNDEKKVQPVFDANTYILQEKQEGVAYESEKAIKKFEISKGISSIRDVIMERMPEVYTKMDEIRNQKDEKDRVIPLNHERGTRFIEQGDDVLEFDLAGSGFKQFRAEHKEFHGKNDIKSGTYDLKMKDDATGMVKRRIEEQYGLSQRVNGKLMKDIRMKENGKKVRYTIAGAEGMISKGDYGIETVRNYVSTLGQQYLTGIFQKWKQGDSPHDIHIMIRGHSRGGVAALQGAMMLKYWVSQSAEFSAYEKYVKFDVTQYDPVAGFGSNSDENEKISYTGKGAGPLVAMNGDKMKPLGDSAESTVVYSIHSNWPAHLFTPQQIMGVKRIILTPFEHKVGTGEVDKSQPLTQEQRDKGQVGNRMAFKDAATQQAYRGSGINDLAGGVYIMDEQHTLIQLKTYKDAKEVLEKVLSKTYFQSLRHDAIFSALREWYHDNSYDSYFSQEFEDTSKQLDQLKDGNRSESFVNACKAVDDYKLEQERFHANDNKTEQDYKNMMGVCSGTRLKLVTYLETHKGWHFTGAGRERVAKFQQLYNIIGETTKGLEKDQEKLNERTRTEKRQQEFKDLIKSAVHMTESREIKNRDLNEAKAETAEFMEMKNRMKKMMEKDPSFKNLVEAEALEIIEENLNQVLEEDSVIIMDHLLDEQHGELDQGRVNLLKQTKDDYREKVERDTPVLVEQVKTMLRESQNKMLTDPQIRLLNYKLITAQTQVSDFFEKQMIL